MRHNCNTNYLEKNQRSRLQRNRGVTRASDPAPLQSEVSPLKGTYPPHRSYMVEDACYDGRAPTIVFFREFFNFGSLTPLQPPEPLPLQDLSNFVPKNGFPVVKGLRPLPKTDLGTK